MAIAAQLGGLTALLLLLCPISMGAMMWFMGKGMRSGRNSDRSLTDLKSEQARLAEKIATLESDKPAHNTDTVESPKVA